MNKKILIFILCSSAVFAMKEKEEHFVQALEKILKADNAIELTDFFEEVSQKYSGNQYRFDIQEAYKQRKAELFSKKLTLDEDLQNTFEEISLLHENKPYYQFLEKTITQAFAEKDLATLTKLKDFTVEEEKIKNLSKEAMQKFLKDAIDSHFSKVPKDDQKISKQPVKKLTLNEKVRKAVEEFDHNHKNKFYFSFLNPLISQFFLAQDLWSLKMLKDFSVEILEEDLRFMPKKDAEALFKDCVAQYLKDCQDENKDISDEEFGLESKRNFNIEELQSLELVKALHGQTKEEILLHQGANLPKNALIKSVLNENSLFEMRFLLAFLQSEAREDIPELLQTESLDVRFRKSYAHHYGISFAKYLAKPIKQACAEKDSYLLEMIYDFSLPGMTEKKWEKVKDKSVFVENCLRFFLEGKAKENFFEFSKYISSNVMEKTCRSFVKDFPNVRYLITRLDPEADLSLVPLEEENPWIERINQEILIKRFKELYY